MDPGGLAQWTKAVQDNFKPTPWDQSAAAILKTLDVA